MELAGWREVALPDAEHAWEEPGWDGVELDSDAEEPG